MYADSVVTHALKSGSEMQEFMNKELNNFSSWFKNNKLNINISKTNCLLMEIDKTSKEMQ